MVAYKFKNYKLLSVPIKCLYFLDQTYNMSVSSRSLNLSQFNFEPGCYNQSCAMVVTCYDQIMQSIQ